jgi:uncharacterized protein
LAFMGSVAGLARNRADLADGEHAPQLGRMAGHAAERKGARCLSQGHEEASAEMTSGSAANGRRRSTRPMAMAVNWIVKPSKLCNLRCRYCYEWDELANRQRMSFELWERLLYSIREYHDLQTERLGHHFETRIIWHGGEPAILPLGYYERVFALQDQILGSNRNINNLLQSNLYSLSVEKVEFFKRHRVQLGVSFDVIGGVRLNGAGHETEDVVVANMDRLLEQGIRLGAITVLAGHTHRHVVLIYNFYESFGLDFRLLPLFDAPLNTPSASFALTSQQAVDALCRLFRHWIRRPERVRVHPLVEYTYAVHQKLTGQAQTRFDRRVSEWALVVNTDGDVYQVMDAYDPALAHGNLHSQSFQSMMGSLRYKASLERDEELFRRHCGPCRFRDACTSLPLYEARRTNNAERCSIAYGVMEHIEAYFHSHKVKPEQIFDFLS